MDIDIAGLEFALKTLINEFYLHTESFFESLYRYCLSWSTCPKSMEGLS